MMLSGQRAAFLAVGGIVAMVMQCVIGVAGTAHAYETGNSYFENAGPGQPYTPNASPYCAGGDLVGDVIPNYTRPTQGCDFTGAVGERRMEQVTGIAPGNGDLRDKFYQVLYWDYHWGDAWERAGAAQVALSLLGYGFGSHVGNRTVTDAQWIDLHLRITAPDIEMLWSSPNCRQSYCLPGADFQYNTAGIIVNGQYDSIRVDNGPGILVDAWVFRSRNSNAVYATYEIECANGIGNIAGLPRPADWSINGQSYVRKSNDPTNHQGTITAAPNDTIYWSHDMRNNGPDNMDRTVYYNVDKWGFIGPASWWNGNKDPTGNAKGTVGQLFVADYPTWGPYSVKSITQDDVGATMCQRIAWRDASSGEFNAWGASGGACVSVPYNYGLTTRVDMNSSVTEPGTTIAPINPYVTNSGPTKSFDGTAWQVSKFILAPGKPIPGAASDQPTPCAAYGGCTVMPGGTGTGTFNPGDSLVGQVASYVVEDVPMGSRICFALSVNKYDANQANGARWYDGAPTCVMVGKKPKVQVWGGDAATRAGINVSLTQKTTGVYGSWVEYGAFSVGSNLNFASGAGLSAKPGAQPSSTQLDWSKLTFANVDPDKNPRYGQYYASASAFRQLPAIAQYFAAIGSQGAFVGNKTSANAFQTGGSITVRTAGDITLQADTLTPGRSVVVVSSGTVTIDGDQLYQDGAPYTAVAQLPQLVIIAKNINITAATKQVDAWLIATDATSDKTGIINTCSDAPQSLTGNDCKDTLTIHGPVEARQLLLRRTAGSGVGQPDSGDPAEVIDLRADAYLWAQLAAAGAGKAQTVYTTELPPRF